MWNELYLNTNVSLKLVKLLGAEVAVYVSMLPYVVKRVSEKQTYDAEGYFPLDRNYIEQEIGYSLETQYNCDSILQRTGIMTWKEDSRDQVNLNLARLTEIITDNNPESLEALKKKSALPKSVVEKNASNARNKTKAQAAEIKKESKLKGFKQIAESQPLSNLGTTVVEALHSWVAMTIDKLNRAAIEKFCKDVGEYSNDPKVVTEVVEVAACRSYRDAVWAITVYEKNTGRVNQKPNPANMKIPQKIATEDSVNTDISF